MDLRTATTAELQLECLERAIVRADQTIAEHETTLARLRLKQESRRRELIATGARAARERAAASVPSP